MSRILNSLSLCQNRCDFDLHKNQGRTQKGDCPPPWKIQKPGGGGQVDQVLRAGIHGDPPPKRIPGNVTIPH